MNLSYVANFVIELLDSRSPRIETALSVYQSSFEDILDGVLSVGAVQ